MQDSVRWARKSSAAPEDGRRPNQHKDRVSQGIAALIPNDIRPDEVLTWNSDLRACHVLFLMRGDMSDAELSTRAKTAGFEPMGSKRNAELWLVAKGR
jgi:hypothetical protein